MKMKEKILYIILTLIVMISYGACSKGSNSYIDTKASKTTEKEDTSYVPEGYRKVWEDNFDSIAINTDNWVVASLKDPVSGDWVPGAAGEHLLNTSYAGYITEEDTYIEDSCLVLRNQKRSYEGSSPAGTYAYTSGWVMSMHRVAFNSGYVEIKAKFPSGDKVWPAMWLIAEDLIWGPEWDMWEYFGDNENAGKDVMGCHLCYGEWPDINWKSYFIEDFDATYDCESWHVYGFLWTTTCAQWYIDGKLVRNLTNNDMINWPNEDMYIVLNNGQKTTSSDNNTQWPNYLIVDNVALYQKR